MTQGLRKVGNYEDTLAAATKDEQHVAGVINPYLANAATRIINNPEFQRVKDRLEEDLTQQTKNHMDQANFEHHVTNLAVDARINRSDLDHIIGNLQQPPPPPAPPPPPNDAAADRARLIAELDGMAQERERQSRQEMMAQRNAMDLVAQQVATPAQQIIREFHHVQQPIYIPAPQIPPQENHSEMMRQMGLTMQQIFLAQQPQQGGYRPPQDEIPIIYNNQGPPPGAPPGGGRILARSYGPTRIPRERYTPFQGGGPPPAPGGATSPMPVRPQPPPPPPPAPPSIPIRFPGRGQRLPDDPRFVPFSGRSQRLPEPEPEIVIPATRPPKRKGNDQGGGVKIPKTARFPGQGNRLPNEPRFTPFSGQAQRLPEENNLRANAIQRMRELGHQGEQQRRGREMVDRQADLGRALRRGGARGDVVPLGKRKREYEFAPNPRPAMRRMGERPTGPQQFTIAT